MIITPAKFEDAYKAITPRTVNKPEDLAGAICMEPEVFDLLCSTLESLGYGATIDKMKAASGNNVHIL